MTSEHLTGEDWREILRALEQRFHSYTLDQAEGRTAFALIQKIRSSAKDSPKKTKSRSRGRRDKRKDG